MDNHVKVLRALSQEPASTRRGRPYTQDELTALFEVDKRAKRAALSGKYVSEISSLEHLIFNGKMFMSSPRVFSRAISEYLKTNPDQPLLIKYWFDTIGQRVVGFYCSQGFTVLIDLARSYCPRLYICWALDDAAELLRLELQATGNRTDRVFLLNLTTSNGEAEEESVLDCLRDKTAKALVVARPRKGTSPPAPPTQFMPTPERTTMSDNTDGRARLSQSQAKLAKLVWAELPPQGELRIDTKALAMAMEIDPEKSISSISAAMSVLCSEGVVARIKTGWYKRGDKALVAVYKRSDSPEPCETFDLAEMYPIAGQAPTHEPEQTAPPAAADTTTVPAPPVSHLDDAPQAHANGQNKTADAPSIERATEIFIRLRELEARVSEIQVHRGQEVNRIEEAKARLGELDAGLEQVQTELNKAWAELATVATICASPVSA